MKNDIVSPGSGGAGGRRGIGAAAGNACIFLAALFWGVNVPVTKALIPEWMSADDVVAVRLMGGCVLFWLVSLFMRGGRITGRGDWLRLGVGGVVGLFGFIYLFVTSLRYGSPIDISIIMTLPPMFVILMNVVFRHQRASLTEWAGVLVSFAGAVIVILGGRGGGHAADSLLGDLLAIASTVCYAFYLVVLEGPTKRYRPATMLRWVFLFASLPALFLLPGMRGMPILASASAVPWLEIGFILLCPTFIAYFLVQPAIRSIGSELVSIYQYLVPVVATVAAVLMKLDSLRWPQVLAMAVIVGGMVLTNVGKRRRAAKGG